MNRCTIFVLLGLVLIAPPAFAQVPCSEYPPLCVKIGVYPDSTCTGCNLAVTVNEPSTFYVIGSYNGGDGIVGAEFRVVGIPPEWSYNAIPNPAAILTIGDPVQDGTNIAFPTRQFGPCVVLYRIEIVPTTIVQDLVVAVSEHANPSNPNFPCPRISPGCAPCYTILCADPGQMTINSVDCLVGVEESTWSQIKTLYGF